MSRFPRGEYERVLRGHLRWQQETLTNGARNRLDDRPTHYGEAQGRPGEPILPHPFEDEKLPLLVAVVYWMRNVLTHHIENKIIVEQSSP